MDNKFIWIKDSDGRMYYGGFQKWFNDNLPLFYGCVSVAAANALAVLACRDAVVADGFRLNISNGNIIEKNNFVMFMEAVYREIGIKKIPMICHIYDKLDKNSLIPYKFPVSRGSNTKLGTKGAIRFAKRCGVQLISCEFNLYKADYKECLEFIESGIDSSGAVMMGMFGNKCELYKFEDKLKFTGKLIKREAGLSRHEVTLTGVRKPDDRKIMLIASTWGEKVVIPYDSFWKSLQEKKAKGSSMAYFETVSD